jgi:hypothetical protein
MIWWYFHHEKKWMQECIWRYSTLLDATRRYSKLLDATRRYSMLLDAIRRCSTVLNTALEHSKVCTLCDFGLLPYAYMGIHVSITIRLFIFCNFFQRWGWNDGIWGLQLARIDWQRCVFETNTMHQYERKTGYLHQCWRYNKSVWFQKKITIFSNNSNFFPNYSKFVLIVVKKLLKISSNFFYFFQFFSNVLVIF